MLDLENPYKGGTQKAKIWALLNAQPFNTATWKDSTDIAAAAGFNYRTAASAVSDWKSAAINNYYAPKHPGAIRYYNACIAAQQATVELVALADRRFWSFRRATFRCLQDAAHANWNINVNVNVRPHSKACPACKAQERGQTFTILSPY
jgi:hypothetical protein